MSLDSYMLAPLPGAMSTIPQFHHLNGTHVMGTQARPHPMGKTGKPTDPRVPTGVPTFGSGPPSVNTKQVGIDGPLSKPTALVFVSDNELEGDNLCQRIPELFPVASLVFTPFRIKPPSGSSGKNPTGDSTSNLSKGTYRKNGRPFSERDGTPYGRKDSRQSVVNSLRGIDSIRASNRCQGPAVAGWHVNLELRSIYKKYFNAYVAWTNPGGQVSGQVTDRTSDDILKRYSEIAVCSIPSANELMKMAPLLGGCLCHGLATRGTYLPPQEASTSGQKSVQVQVQKITRLLNVFMVTDPSQKTHPSDPIYLMLVVQNTTSSIYSNPTDGADTNPFVSLFGICDNGAPACGFSHSKSKHEVTPGVPSWETVVDLFRGRTTSPECRKYSRSTPLCIGHVQHPPECQSNQIEFNRNVMNYWMYKHEAPVDTSKQISIIKRTELDHGHQNSVAQRLRHIAVDLR